MLPPWPWYPYTLEKRPSSATACSRRCNELFLHASALTIAPDGGGDPALIMSRSFLAHDDSTSTSESGVLDPSSQCHAASLTTICRFFDSAYQKARTYAFRSLVTPLRWTSFCFGTPVRQKSSTFCVWPQSPRWWASM